MRLFQVPGPSTAHSQQSTTLSGTSYVIQYNWVQRLQRWHFDMLQTNGDPIVRGVKLVVGPDLLARFRADPRIPPGGLFVVNSIQLHANEDPGWGSFEGETHALYYVTSETTSADPVEVPSLPPAVSDFV